MVFAVQSHKIGPALGTSRANPCGPVALWPEVSGGPFAPIAPDFESIKKHASDGNPNLSGMPDMDILVNCPLPIIDGH